MHELKHEFSEVIFLIFNAWGQWPAMCN